MFEWDHLEVEIMFFFKKQKRLLKYIEKVFSFTNKNECETS